MEGDTVKSDLSGYLARLYFSTRPIETELVSLWNGLMYNCSVKMPHRTRYNDLLRQINEIEKKFDVFRHTLIAFYEEVTNNG